MYTWLCSQKPYNQYIALLNISRTSRRRLFELSIFPIRRMPGQLLVLLALSTSALAQVDFILSSPLRLIWPFYRNNHHHFHYSQNDAQLTQDLQNQGSPCYARNMVTRSLLLLCLVLFCANLINVIYFIHHLIHHQSNREEDDLTKPMRCMPPFKNVVANLPVRVSLDDDDEATNVSILECYW